MQPIIVPLPTGESSCYPTTTQNVIQCYSDNNTLRTTYLLQLDVTNNNRGNWHVVSNDRNYNYQPYQPSGVALTGYQIYPELTGFWFPLISSILVALCFLFVYRVLFRRFIK